MTDHLTLLNGRERKLVFFRSLRTKIASFSRPKAEVLTRSIAPRSAGISDAKCYSHRILHPRSIIFEKPR
jgi:hypothetical protein